MYQKLQALLPEFMIEPVTIDNLSTYEIVFYSNEEYYRLTDGHPATRELCEDTLCDYPPYKVYSVGVSQNGHAMSFLSVLEGYPDAETLYVGLLLVDEKYKRKSIGTTIMKALFKVAADMNFKNLKLSVQENNISGLNFWKKIGFYEIDRCTCDGFDNLSMKYDINEISFPKHEYESIQNYLNKLGYCYTTRVYKEIGKYKVGELYTAPWGGCIENRRS